MWDNSQAFLSGLGDTGALGSAARTPGHTSSQPPPAGSYGLPRPFRLLAHLQAGMTGLASDSPPLRKMFIF